MIEFHFIVLVLCSLVYLLFSLFQSMLNICVSVSTANRIIDMRFTFSRWDLRAPNCNYVTI